MRKLKTPVHLFTKMENTHQEYKKNHNICKFLTLLNIDKMIIYFIMIDSIHDWRCHNNKKTRAHNSWKNDQHVKVIFIDSE